MKRLHPKISLRSTTERADSIFELPRAGVQFRTIIPDAEKKQLERISHGQCTDMQDMPTVCI